MKPLLFQGLERQKDHLLDVPEDTQPATNLPNPSFRGESDQTLAERFREQIRRDGPISFHDWMQAALYDPQHGYYCRSDRERWGRLGDYRTAPEISPLFAATFARYFANLYAKLGNPDHWSIIEAGAGSGDFARGVLNSLEQQHPQVFTATRYLIDEISPSTRANLSESLSEYARKIEFTHLDEAEPVNLGILFSNELLDAFPVYRMIARHNELLELRVGLDGSGSFRWVESEVIEPRLKSYLERTPLEMAEGQVWEVNLDAAEWVTRAASWLRRGFLVSVDYGAERQELLTSPDRRQGTLRAFFRHQMVDDIFARPGRQDLTTTVDWTGIREAARSYGFSPLLYERLDRFLLSSGFLEELERQTCHQSAPESTKMRSSAREMIMPYGMAANFQVLVQHKD